LGYLDKEEEFEARAIGWDVRDIIPSVKVAVFW
jgi:hypothetical protein